ncbi:hypothetical protein LTS16_008409 [Friedmanniomyces endolithicus]|uniref:Uncharacterized protein n=1 Tax=Friedmanniomyces endolithicus TaxID=329885 RepID=A0AAN6FJY4_9PEZI|nr:hypothetical protein LTR35_016696 [Friedmanniomyces endolithicus]KAK0299875.1 hypothetical protein LTS00_001645 [Friedmanniomyces endolithicus]KAK0317960.1 hypothetical protein LTR82_010950 [Friedmanniomyces endolithicus]KAK0895240.1 hypothetical protein LTR57_023141 [Friedmanniomyces endolithicus]KAK0966280.1 hypothetical protein LTS01_017890 [Friedmanniomyces endolithicus]
MPLSAAKPGPGTTTSRPAPQEAYWKWQPEKALKALQQQTKTEIAKTKFKARAKHTAGEGRSRRHQDGPVNVDNGEYKEKTTMSAEAGTAGSALPKFTNMYEWLRFAPDDTTAMLGQSGAEKPGESRAVKAREDESGAVVRGRTREGALPVEAREIGKPQLAKTGRGEELAGAIEKAVEPTRRALPGSRRLGNLSSATDRKASGGEAGPPVHLASRSAFDAAVQHWPDLPLSERESTATSANPSMRPPSGPPGLTFPGLRVSGNVNRKKGDLGQTSQAVESSQSKLVDGYGDASTSIAEERSLVKGGAEKRMPARVDAA